MKMKNLFVLLAAITLVACSSNSSRNESSNVVDDSTSAVLDDSASSNNPSTSSNTDASTSSNTGTSTNPGTSTSTTVDGETLTFNFYNNESLKGADTKSLNEKLATFMNQVATFAFVSNIANSNCQVIANAPTDGDTVLVIGSGSAEGELQFTFANTIKSVSITAWTYHKPYTNHETGNEVPNVDTGASCYVNIDTNLIDLAPVNGEPVEKTESFDINGKTLKLYNKAKKNRAFIKSMTFVY